MILLEAGYLATQGKERTTQLTQAIANLRVEPELYHNLTLAAECIRDVRAGRVLGNLDVDVQQRLRKELEMPPPKGVAGSMQLLFGRRLTPRALSERRIAAAMALARIGGALAKPPKPALRSTPEWVVGRSPRILGELINLRTADTCACAQCRCRRGANQRYLKVFIDGCRRDTTHGRLT